MLLLRGCSPVPAGTDTVMCDVNPFGWLNDACLRIDNTDTLAAGDLLLAVRINADNESDRLPLTIEFTAPDSSRFVETCIFPLPQPDKNPTSPEVFTIPYRQGVTLSQEGAYTVRLKPAERLRGIEAIGFTFQKYR